VSACCDGCTCSRLDPTPNRAVVDHEIVDADPSVITEGWQMTGLISGRDTMRPRRRDVPILRPTDGPVEWSTRELHLGVRVIDLCVDAEDPNDAYLKVLGSDPKRVYATWQRVAVEVGSNGWFDNGEPF
jgi:hypothetical protein